MTATVATRPVRLNYSPAKGVDARIATAWGVQLSTAQQALKVSSRESVFSRVRTALQVMVGAGQRERAEAVLNFISEPFQAAEVPALCPSLLIAESDTEAALTQARTRYLLDSSDANAHAYIEALHRHEFKARMVDLAMSRELQSA